MDIFKELEKLSTKYIDISDKKEREALEKQYRDIFCKLETIKIAHRNEIESLSNTENIKKKEVAKLEEDKQKLEIKIEEQKASVASGLNILWKKEAEVAKMKSEFEKEKAEFEIEKKELSAKLNVLLAKWNEVDAKLQEIEKKLATDNSILEQIKGREVSLQISIEKMEAIMTENKRLESATLDEKTKLLEAKKQLAKDYALLIKKQEDLEEIKLAIKADKEKLEKAREDFEKERNIIQTMKYELQEIIDKNKEKTKELAEREANVKVALKNIDDKERSLEAKDRDIRMERAILSENKTKFNLLMKEKWLKPEDLDI